MLSIKLLGRMAVERDGQQLPVPASRRAWSLLAYLALHPGPQPRGELAARFWPDVLDASARASLRSAIWALRRTLEPFAPGLLLASREDVGLLEEAEVRVDALAFAELLVEGRDREAVELCDGELLSGLEEEWISVAREEHREQLLGALERLATACELEGDRAGTIHWSRRQAAVDPFGEEAHRRLIARLADSGDRAAALVVYRTLAERLRRELAVAPSQLTRELAESLRAEPVPVNVGPSLAGMLTLVGRRSQLEQLLGAWSEVAAGRGGVVSLSAEAGIGKTRLASELLARVAAQGAATAGCAALDLGGAAPFGLWSELIGELLPGLAPPPANAVWPDDLAHLAPEIHARFERPAAERAPASPELERTRLMEAVVALLEWAARDRPLALLLEDVHIADAASLELTGYVARRVAGLPVLLVLTRRQRPRRVDADQLEHALRARGLLRLDLQLAPLEGHEISELARLAAPLSAPDVDRVVRAAEGNALLAVEMSRALARGQGELSEGLGGTVRGAFGALTPAARGFAELAAVASRALDAAEISALPLEQPALAAAEALDSGMFITSERRIAFRHALLREAVYAELSEPARVALHELWARVLLQREGAGGAQRPAEPARHLRLAGRDLEAVEQLVRAAAQARRIAALAEAAGYLREGAALAPDRADVLLELAEVEAWGGHREEAEESFARALELLQMAPPSELAAAWLRRARWYHGPICFPALVLESARNAIELLDRAGASVESEPLRREALAALAWAEAVAGSVEEAERLLSELHGLMRDRPADDLSTYDIGHARAFAAMRRGDFEGAYAPSIAAGEAIARAGRPDLAYGCWSNAAGAAAAAGDLTRALGFLDRAQAVLAGRGLAVLEMQICAGRSFLLLRKDDRDGARAAAEAEAALAVRIGEPPLLAMAAHDRGLVALADRDFPLAARLLGEALVEGAPISRALTRLARAEALACSGALEEAAAEVRATALEPLRASDWPETLVPRLARVQGLIAAQAGERPLAVRRLQEAVEGWRRQIARQPRGERIAAVLADLGRPVVGIVEPERELERVVAELGAIQANEMGAPHALLS
jgi:DNA-binding SARP family transcriptional activator/tetratricopeptide (TPR) repeat protein